jgi:hypothetical protein
MAARRFYRVVRSGVRPKNYIRYLSQWGGIWHRPRQPSWDSSKVSVDCRDLVGLPDLRTSNLAVFSDLARAPAHFSKGTPLASELARFALESSAG